MGRRASREVAMKLLYQLELQKDDREDQIKTCLEENLLSEIDANYFLDIIEGVNTNTLYINKIITRNSKGWKIDRLSKVDLSILRLGIYEMSFREDIPYSVSINEAVELAKKYSGDEAGAFINGVLGKVATLNTPNAQEKNNEKISFDEKGSKAQVSLIKVDKALSIKEKSEE